MEKQLVINNILIRLEKEYSGKQLKQIQTAIVFGLKDYNILRKKNELVKYDETKDIVAYKQYFVSKKIQGLSDNTLGQYKNGIDRFMAAVTKPFSEVTHNDIRLYLANREYIDGLCNASMIRERGIICGFFDWLHIEEFIAKDPGKRVEPIKREKRIKQAFTDIEVEQLRNAAITAKEKVVIELLLSTGCRVSELCRLVFENLDKLRQRIRVIGKGNKERWVYLNPPSQIALVIYCEKAGHDTGWLIRGKKKDRPMTASGIQMLVKRIGERAGITNVHPHRFRRTSATIALRRGMSMEIIMSFLGHQQMDTTLKYAMISDDELERQHRQYMS